MVSIMMYYEKYWPLTTILGVHLINAFIFITCLSAINSSIYIGSRTILYMAQSGKAPRILGRVNKWGVPVWAIFVTNAVGALSMMNISTGAKKAYGYIVNLSGVSTFIVWASICLIHIRFRQAWVAQNRDTSELPYKSLWYPYLAYFGLSANLFLAIVQGWTTLSPFDAGNFVDAYILLPLFGIIYGACKLYWGRRDQLKAVGEIDLDSGRRIDLDQKGSESRETEQIYNESEKLPFWKKIWNWF